MSFQNYQGQLVERKMYFENVIILFRRQIGSIEIWYIIYIERLEFHVTKILRIVYIINVIYFHNFCNMNFDQPVYRAYSFVYFSIILAELEMIYMTTIIIYRIQIDHIYLL